MQPNKTRYKMQDMKMVLHTAKEQKGKASWLVFNACGNENRGAGYNKHNENDITCSPALSKIHMAAQPWHTMTKAELYIGTAIWHCIATLKPTTYETYWWIVILSHQNNNNNNPSYFFSVWCFLIELLFIIH